MVDISHLSTQDPDFWQRLKDLVAWDESGDTQVRATVREIIVKVRAQGDQALLELTQSLDQWSPNAITDLEMPLERLQQALASIPKPQRQALETAADRLRVYAQQQKLESWRLIEADGNMLGQQVTPLERVGLYVPGGKAAYPSSVLMNAIPAKVAGVEELVMVVPTPTGAVNSLVLAAAAVAGVDKVFSIGGAQAVAALAYGTESVPAVDKIVGPGNRYVAEAKRQVFGVVGIDMIAGPSEILVLCDGHTNPDWIAMDLFSQAEHDEDAQAILLTPDAGFLEQVRASIAKLLPSVERSAIIQASLSQRGALILVRDLAEAVQISNFIAPEHLELSVTNPEALLPQIRHAGAVFMGRYSAEVLGDYCAGPNHVLPTARTARFSSPLGVYDFQKRSSLIHCSVTGAMNLAPTASVLAKGEGLTAHARSAEFRLHPGEC